MAVLPVYVISLKRSEERRTWVKEHLESNGVSFEFFDAVEGKTLDKSFIKNIVNVEKSYIAMNRQLSNGEIGCAFSHINVFKKMVSEKIPMAIVLEDDCRIIEQESFIHILNLGVNDIKPYGLVLLGYTTAEMYRQTQRYDIAAMRVCSFKKRLLHDLEIVTPDDLYYLTIGYVITNKAAAQLLKHIFPLRMPIDWVTGLSERYGVRLGVLNKPVVCPNENIPSEINDREIAPPRIEVLHLNPKIAFIKKIFFCNKMNKKLWSILKSIFNRLPGAWRLQYPE